MKDLEKAKEIFAQGKYSFVLVKDDDIITCSERGLINLVELIESQKDYSEYSICDKVCGRASAFLYVLLGLKEVHAVKMAKLAVQILDRAEIEFSFETSIDTVLDEKMEAVDKFETAVVKSGSAVNALKDIKAVL
ncbi:MAG: DUF1893 domain-containing protein [Treponema sp.]|uniref:DUF1893 domain-containing protein n=1 Tax=Treponema sp. TaxID=166 RepID=UPI001B5EBC78|nr:DUF1893 domain-containing protein [Treponema sp.]MBP5402437.1 DUF1893 domain-containing protein [Treponema sp.]MBR5933296.1 DUF1893 domain-containing protein [Treponema sp.]